MMFRVGQKIVCVDATPNEWDPRPLLRKDHVYTVHGLSDGSLLLAEVVRPEGFRGFRASRFRPATDISLFTSMLNNVPLHDKEHA